MVLALSESLNLVPEQAVALAVNLAQQDQGRPTETSLSLKSPSPGETESIPGGVHLSDEQIDIVVRHLIHMHQPDSFRRLDAKFRATTYRASAQRLRASWTRVHASQDTTSAPAPEPF
ncbi:hypothetical protein ACFC3O_29325 [Streptomyces sp. NPDC056007]|uniref:hypothetical protein n=1 Tax=Streptomyces sp. NPDC056007 TaxID=3345678 RepID=UPI0017AAAF97|nr:hypothetical protein [Streptomyces sp. SJ1-7]